YKHSAREFADMIVDQFDELLRQSARQPLVCPISLHPFVVGRPYRLPQLRRALEHVARHRDRVWLTRPGEICAHIESLPRGVVPAATRGSVGLAGTPPGRKMGVVRARRGHMTLLPVGAAYQFHAAQPGVLLLQTLAGADTVECWADICQTTSRR